MGGRARRTAAWVGAGAVAVAGCAGRPVVIPPGHRPPPAAPADVQTAVAVVVPDAPPPRAEPKGGPNPGRPPFELPPDLPGASAPAVDLPRFTADTPRAEREKAVRDAYPEPRTPPPDTPTLAAAGTPLTLADLQRIAADNSPVLARARADADAAYGQVVQAGLYPNPTVGYQADQWQPNLRRPTPPLTGSGAGQQGGFINQLIKTAHKLTLAQQVAGYDYVNALVAVRRAEIDVLSAVRSRYFAALVAKESVEVNRTLAGLADEVYRLELKQVAAGLAAGYEPYQLFAQAELARNALTQAEAGYRAAWLQLAAAVGRPDLPPAPLAGSADAPVPGFDPAAVQARMLDQHTDLLTARNAVAQAQTNLTLQRRLPIPDIETNQYHQYDNLAQVYQFGVQVGVQLPTFDRNQGNVRTAQARIGRATADLEATRNDLLGRLADAVARYDANRAVAERFRGRVLPNFARAYRALVRRYAVEPDKLDFNDIVVAQQNYGQALQGYLSALQAQWQAVVDVANLAQLDDLYPPPAAPER